MNLTRYFVPFITLCMILGEFCQALPLRILWRNSKLSLQTEEKVVLARMLQTRASLNPEEITGHVAIELPDGRIMGWSPQVWGTSVAEMASPRPGIFANDTHWAVAGYQLPVLGTNAITFEVTTSQLEIVLKNMESIRGANYQLIPGTPGGYNCVTVLPIIFKGTSVTLPLIPDNGSISKFAENARATSFAWTGNCHTALVHLSDLLPFIIQ